MRRANATVPIEGLASTDSEEEAIIFYNGSEMTRLARVNPPGHPKIVFAR